MYLLFCRGSRSAARSLSRSANSQGQLIDEYATEGVDQRTAAGPEESSGKGTQLSDALANEQMVWEMLYNPAYSLSTEEAETAWHRAMGQEVHSGTEVKFAGDALDCQLHPSLQWILATS